MVYMIMKKKLLLVIILASLTLRLLLGYFLDGSFDTFAWKTIAAALRNGEGIYSSKTIYFSPTWQLYNYPPLWAYVIQIFDGLSRVFHLPFSFFLKIPVMVAEIIMVYIISSQSKKFHDRFKVWLLLYANPFAIILAGYHGQFDLLFLLFIVLAICSVESKKWLFVILYNAISLAWKTIPLIVLPAQVNSWPKGGKKILILFSIISLPMLFLMPYVFDPKSVNGVTRIFNYYGLTGVWGLPKALDWLLRPLPDGLNSWILTGYLEHRKNIFIIFYLFTTSMVYLSKMKMLRGVYVLFLTFNCFASGFGVQYFYWLLPFGLWLKRFKEMTVYLFLVTIFSLGFYLKYLSFHDKQLVFFSQTIVAFYEKFHLAGIIGSLIYILCFWWWLQEIKIMIKPAMLIIGRTRENLFKKFLFKG